VHPDQAWPFLSDPRYPLLSAVWAIAIHGVLAVFVVSPLLRHAPRHRAALVLGAFVAGSAFDLDHIAAAGSLNPHALETLSGGRPDTHSLIVVVALTVIAYVLTRRREVAWAVFAIFLSHLLFDAAGGYDHVLYPFSGLDGLPWLACPIGALVLFSGSLAITARDSRVRPALETA
jgi:membrane-bound metal-dependent hydrolase YbcI (DUF457 family)